MRVAVAYVACAVVWGTTWFAIRGSIGPGGFPTMAGAALRFTLAAAVVGPLLLTRWVNPRPGRRELLWILAAGVLNAAGYLLVYRAEEDIPGGLASVIYGTMPLMTGLIAAATRTERLTRETLLGALLGLAGLTIIGWDRMEVSPDQALGVVLVLASVACASTYTVLLKRAVGDLHPLAFTAAFLPATGVALWAITGSLERQPLPWPPPLVPSLYTLYLAVFGSIVAFAAYFYLVRRVRLTTLTTLTFVEPLLALVIDAAFEERVTLVPRTYVGAAVTLAGVLVAMLVRSRPAAAVGAPALAADAQAAPDA